MNFNTDIIVIANGIIDSLKSNDFFEEHPFVGEEELFLKLVEQMIEKRESSGEYILTDTEFLNAAKEVSEEAIGETIAGLIDKGALNMSIDEDGEIRYSANPDFNPDNLFEDE